MESGRTITAATRMLVVVLVLFLVSFTIDLVYGDITWGNFHVFIIPSVFTLVIFIIFSFRRAGFDLLHRRARFFIAFISFLFMVLLGSLPFMLTETVDPISAVFESMAGFTTTGLTSVGTSELEDYSHGILFFRVAIQWAGGLFYLVFAFMFLSDISDVAKRSVDRRIFSRIGLIPNLTSLIQNLTIIYGLFTFISFIAFNIAGKNVFESICLSMGTISTGGITSDGNVIGGGTSVILLVSLFMFLSGMGYYVHMSLLSARGRRKTIFDIENVSYTIICLTVPVLGAMILMSAGMSMGDSLVNGILTTISALTTTGFMAEGMDTWPDSMKILLVLLMLLGGSSLSLSSGFKLQRFFLLVKGFLAEVKRSSHPSAVISLRRGEGSYSEEALESANMAFFYLFSLLALSIVVLLVFHDDIFEAVALSATTVSNSGIAFGDFSTPQGISELNGFVKLVLSAIMLFGRFEILLPLYIVTMRGRRFTG